jgi:hypothetical protein
MAHCKKDSGAGGNVRFLDVQSGFVSGPVDGMWRAVIDRVEGLEAAQQPCLTPGCRGSLATAINGVLSSPVVSAPDLGWQC